MPVFFLFGQLFKKNVHHNRETMTEEQLVKGCLKGEAQAQKALFEQYSGKMLSLCKRYAGSQEEAEDIFQEGFIKVYEKLNQFSGTGSLGGWIRMVMINTALIHIRKNKQQQYDEAIEEAKTLDSGDINALAKMSLDDLEALINSMPLGYKTVFNLFAVEGYAHKEIAEMLGISESTSKTQFLKARAFLKRSINEIELK